MAWNGWTEDIINLLRHFTGRKMSARKIAAELGCTRNAVIGKWNRLGITVRGSAPRQPYVRPPDTKRRRSRGPAIPLVDTLAHGEIPVMPASQPVPEPFYEPEPEPERELEPIVEVPEPITSGPVTIYDLRPCHCRYIAGPVLGAMTLYCGAMRAEPSPYCAEHRALAKGVGSSPERGALAPPRTTTRSMKSGAFI